MRTIRFSDFTIDLDNMDLYRRGKRIKIGKKPLDVLLFLIQNRHKTVTQEALREHIWRSTEISSSTIPMCMLEIRKALDDNTTRPRFLSSSRGRGYRFIDAIRAETAAEQPADSRLELPLVGRKGAIESLYAGTRSALNYLQGAFVNILGEAGIGKTRLVCEFTRIAASQFDFIIAGTTALNQGAPYSIWTQVIRLINQRYPHNNELNRSSALIARLLPGPGKDQLAPNSVAMFDRAKLFETWSLTLKSITKHRPLVIVLEDLHQADDDSILLLDHLVREISSVPVVIIATARPSLLSREGLGSMGHLFDSASHATIHLRPLSANDIEKLLDPYSDSREEIAREIFSRTLGIPYYVTHMIRSQMPDLCDLRPDREIRFSAADAIGITSKQLADLPEWTKRTLTTASVAGTFFSLKVVARALGVSTSDAMENLTPAIVANMIEGDGIHFKFSHSILRDSLYQGMPPRSRSDIHRTIALILSSESVSTVSPSVVFSHFKNSIPATSPSDACSSGLSAGENAISRFAYLEATRILRDALDIARSSQDVPTALQVRIMISLSRALIYSDRREEARKLLIEGARLARQCASPTLLAQCGLAMAPDFLSIEVGTYDPELLLILRQALDRLPDDESSLRAKILARVALMNLWCPSERDHTGVWAQQSLEAARRSTDPGALVFALAAHADSVHGPDLTDERIKRVLVLRESVLAHADERSFLIQQTRLIAALLEKGEVRRVYIENERYREVAEAIGLSQFLWYPGLTDSMLACLAGRFDQAEAHADQYKRLAGNSPDRNFIQAYACQRSLREIERDQTKLVLPMACEFASQQRSVLSWAAAVAWMQWDAGFFDAARETLRQFSEADIRSMFREVGGTIGIATLSEVSAHLGDSRRSTLLFDLTSPVSDRFATAGYGIAYFGSLARSSSLLATSLGRSEDAVKLARSAVKAELAIGSRSWLVYAELDLLRAKSCSMSIDHSRFQHELARLAATARDLSLPRAARCVADALTG
jgi:DNA-binding winged helix-turn-helix (wHTH) protein